jgi:hypothetical protein
MIEPIHDRDPGDEMPEEAHLRLRTLYEQWSFRGHLRPNGKHWLIELLIGNQFSGEYFWPHDTFPLQRKEDV